MGESGKTVLTGSVPYKSTLAIPRPDGSIPTMQTKLYLPLLLAFLASPLAHADLIADLTARAEKGEAPAQLELAGLLSKGEGANRNMDEALKWYAKAAEQGSGEAQMILGSLYISGKKGIRKNSAEAAKWFTLSAQSGSAPSQCQLARMHMSGAGVAKDDVEAYKWATLAAAQEDKTAVKILSFLDQRMTPEQTADAKQRATDLKNGKPVDEITTPEVPAIPVEPLPPVEPE
ncbi:MAG: sel1 repeat family protein [Verrucomicrobiaceae bacterium]|nr:MAG: sel1 repeat family protein [Verrucomicrobiaceae bacterium]